MRVPSPTPVVTNTTEACLHSSHLFCVSGHLLLEPVLCSASHVGHQTPGQRSLFFQSEWWRSGWLPTDLVLETAGKGFVNQGHLRRIYCWPRDFFHVVMLLADRICAFFPHGNTKPSLPLVWTYRERVHGGTDLTALSLSLSLSPTPRVCEEHAWKKFPSRIKHLFNAGGLSLGFNPGRGDSGEIWLRLISIWILPFHINPTFPVESLRPIWITSPRINPDIPHESCSVPLQTLKYSRLITQPGITPYRAHAHERYSSIEWCPRAHISDFFRATQNEM